MLRLAGPADLDDLLRQKQRFDATLGIESEPAVARRALGELLARPELGRAWRILEGGAAVGYAVLCFGFSLEWGGRDAFLDEIYLEPAARGRGLGRAALRALVEEARAAGVVALHLEVDDTNSAGQALYRSEGFSGRARQLLTRRLR